VLIIVVIVLPLIAHRTGHLALAQDQRSSSKHDRPQESSDGCNDISISEFRSLKKYEVGLGPKGQVTGYWSIEFRKGENLSDYGRLGFQWHHSDTSDEGTYGCEEGALRIKLSGHTFTAKYDRHTRILVWKGVEYKKIR